jgi:hypothetical protein
MDLSKEFTDNASMYADVSPVPYTEDYLGELKSQFIGINVARTKGVIICKYWKNIWIATIAKY